MTTGTTGSLSWWGNGTNQTAARSRIKTFQCPTDMNDTITPTSGEWAYIYTAGNTIYGGYFGPGTGFGKTDYASNAGYIGDGSPANCGPYYNNSKVKLGTITDGTSNTIGFGEYIGGTVSPRNFIGTWIGTGSIATAWGLGNTTTVNGQATTDWYQFAGRHTSGVLFGMCDGSVRSISRTVNTNTFVYASGMVDGAVYTLD